MPQSIDTVLGEDGVRRCWWCGDDVLYAKYHDQEWGIPVREDQKLFEKICLEGFQAGLSWITILRKREAFRGLFHDFELQKVARFSKPRIEKLMSDVRIVRHRGKIESVVNNAQKAIELIEDQGSLAGFLWQFEPRKSETFTCRDQMPSMTEDSKSMSKELKRRGWTFVGPTTCYAMMQAVGMVNDHLRSCDMWETVEQTRKSFSRPR